ncbi:OmpA-like transmembrane region [Nitrobacter hamburgensis X14]|uniref:OmpA-like transmembrane region n=2 Tax=Nitrobacter hamburgensis TaxID=912 RepID=Q1QRH0_NITHX|nr:OmpA-like transmembrane region [Nitrobacter hamburgensis X14]
MTGPTNGCSDIEFLENVMKKILLASVAIVGMAAIVPAQAADLAARPYTKAPVYEAAPIYNWTGFYLGGHVGGAFGGDHNLAAPGFTRNGNDGVFMGGGQIGYDYQFSPNWVFGIGANYSFLDTNDHPFVNRGLGSVTGRLGYTWGPALLYAKGGYAWADTRNTNGFGGDTFSNNRIGRDGFTVGGGLEYMFTQNWSGLIEYQYYDFGTTRTTFRNQDVRFRNDEHTIKVGLNYRFNWGAPVGPRY